MLAATKVSRLEEDFLFWLQCEAADIPTPEREYRFHATRKWRFDFAWPVKKVAVEIEGVTHYGAIGRHQNRRGFMGDCEKYEAALLDGWRVYRVPGPWIMDGPETVWRPEVMATLRHLLGLTE